MSATRTMTRKIEKNTWKEFFSKAEKHPVAQKRQEAESSKNRRKTVDVTHERSYVRSDGYIYY